MSFLTGEQVQAPEPGGQDERDSPYGGGKVQTLCLQSGGEEPRPHPQVGREVTRIHLQLPGAFWTRWSLGTFTFKLIHKTLKGRISLKHQQLLNL